MRAQFDLPTTHDVVRIVTAQLVATLSDMLRPDGGPRHEAFFAYARRHLPPRARAVVLTGADGLVCRVYDLGPQHGRPVIALHPLILPDLTDADIDLLHDLDIRLIWPLRPGQLAPHDPVISEAAQIRHSNAALALVQQTYAQGPATLLSFAASSKLALAYARHCPQAVAHVFCPAACEVHGRPQEGARRLARGLIALAEVNERLQQAVISVFARRVLQSRSFPDFLRAQFDGSPADLAIIARELAPPRHGDRMREALLHSLRSARHDFAFQRNLHWDGPIPAGTALHFIHGTEDRIHPLTLIRALAARMPGARLHVIPAAAQLLYGPHWRALLSVIAAQTRAGARRA